MKTSTSSILYTLVALCLIMTSCSRRVNYIESDGALLPVMTEGNKESNKYLIVIAGGPDGDGIMYHYVFPFFKKLERSYQMVYYDQRGSGNAKGSPLKSTFNLAQHAIDLDKIIDKIRVTNAKASIYLIGYSYGASIGLHYINKKEPDGAIDGVIMIS